MIPEFPNFKNFDLDDKKDVEVFTSRFNPYSDFNFASLWLWSLDKKMMISQLNKNLVVLFFDYVSSKPFISFMGSNMIPETASTLIKYSKEKFQTDFLKFVPEEVARFLPESEFTIIPDKDSHDYIYYIPDLANMHMVWKKTLGKDVRQFMKLYSDYKVVDYSIQDAPKTECEKLFNKWAENKKISNYLEINEYKAFQKLFQMKDINMRVVCLYVNKVLVGFTVYEILPNNFVMSHFAKADTTYHRSINSILNLEEAKILNSKGMKSVNWEQDLGIPGLRESKLKYRPSFFLEKFIVKLVDKNN